MTSCSTEGCSEPVKAFGWCATHYMQWRRTGKGEPVRVKTRKPCSIKDCDKLSRGHGLCSKHYTRLRNHGDPERVKVYRDNPEASFWQKVASGGPGECWQWTGSCDPGGYGTFGVRGKTVGAHRWSYLHHVGPIVGGYELDHLCHTRDESCPGGPTCLHRRCVNPAHLEPVPPRENWARSNAPSRANQDKTHCKHGHEFTAANTITRKSGHRGCRECGRRAVAAYKVRKRLTYPQ